MGGLLYVAQIKGRMAVPGSAVDDAVVAGATSEIRPMFMLIVAAMLGKLPAALATSIGSDTHSGGADPLDLPCGVVRGMRLKL